MRALSGRFASVESVAFAIWAAIVLWLMAHHAIWFDEARAWLIATRTPDWSAMFAQTHADGHPATWYVLLRAASWFHNSVTTLYVVQFVFAALAAGYCLALKNVPFILRALLVFGGILGFEYAVVARNYAPAAAALLAFAYYDPQREKRPVLLGLLLALALNVHAGLAPIVPFLMLPWALETLKSRKPAFLIAALIVAAGYLALMLSVYPRHPDSIFTAHVENRKNPLWLDMMPLSIMLDVFTGGISESTDAKYFFPPLAYAAASILICIGCCVSFTDRLFKFCAIGIVIASSAFYGWAYPTTSYRHGAMVVIALFSLLAMDSRHSPAMKNISVAAFGLILAIQTARLAFGVLLPASSSEAVAAAIQSPGLQGAQIYCVPSHMAQSLAALNGRDCMMDHVGRIGAYPYYLFSDQRAHGASFEEIAAWMAEQEQRGSPGLVYIHRQILEATPLFEIAAAWTRPSRPAAIATDAERHHFLGMVDRLSQSGLTLFEENGVLLRLKPEYRNAPSPSASLHISR